MSGSGPSCRVSIVRTAVAAMLLLSTSAIGGDVTAARAAASPPDVPGWFTPLVPARLLDTRPGESTVDGVGRPGAPVGRGGVLDLAVLGRGGVPATGVAAVVINVTATNPTATSFVTVWPSGAPRPLASNLNVVAGQTVPNLVVAKVGVGGHVSLFNRAGSVDLIADIAGYVPLTDGFESLVPARLLDTRAQEMTIDGDGLPGQPLAAGAQLDLTVVDRGGVPSSGVDAVVLNVTATNPTDASFLTVWPRGQARPLASNLNTTRGQTVPNLVVAKVGVGGQVSFFNKAGTVDVIADVAGYFPTGGTFIAVQPARLLETRPTEPVTTGATNKGTPLGQDAEFDFPVLGVGGVPASGVSSVVLNVTAIHAAAPSFLTVWPYGSNRPTASNLNITRAGQTIANLVVAKVGTAGKVKIYNRDGYTDVAVDVAGYFLSEPGRVRSVVADEQGTCSVDALGRVSCWGTNLQDAFAFEGLASPPSRLRPYPLAMFDDAIDVALDYTHTCVLRAGGTVWCWGGGGAYALLGDGSTALRVAPVQVPSVTDVVDVETGYLNTCVVRAVGTVHCWGAGFGGGAMPVPTQVAGLSNIEEVEVSGEQACARRGDGRVLCWGKQGDVGVLGDGSGTDSQTPRLVAGLIDATSLTLTSLRGCAIRAAGRAVCWGNSYLGGGSTGRSLVPVEVTQSSGTAVEDVVGIAGGDDWVCVVLGSGAVYCWGSSWAASVGLAPTAPLSGTTAVTVSVGGLPPVASISAGRFHVCVTTTQADVYCWGSNSAGAVGNGTKVVQTTPLLIIDSP